MLAEQKDPDKVNYDKGLKHIRFLIKEINWQYSPVHMHS